MFAPIAALRFLLSPAVIGFLAARLLKRNSASVSFGKATLVAAVPSGWVFPSTRADGITRAASIVVTPALFIFLLIPAGIGVWLGEMKHTQP